MNYVIPTGEPVPTPLPGRLPGFSDNPDPARECDGPTEGPLGYAVVYDATGQQLDRWYEYANGEDYEATLSTVQRGQGPLVLGPLVRATTGVTLGARVRVGLYDYAGRLAAETEVTAAAPGLPDLDRHVFTFPAGLTIPEDYRGQVLTLWIKAAREAGHTIAEALRPANPLLDPEAARHCGSARVGHEVFDVYARGRMTEDRDIVREMFGVRADEPRAAGLLGGGDQVTRLRELAERSRNVLQADVDNARKQLGDWVTPTAAELTKLVERARNLLHTNVGGDSDRDAVRDQADMLEIVAALLPAWADRGVHPATEANVEMASARLLHILEELESELR